MYFEQIWRLDIRVTGEIIFGSICPSMLDSITFDGIYLCKTQPAGSREPRPAQ
jgi:hypothetical protein